MGTNTLKNSFLQNLNKIALFGALLITVVVINLNLNQNTTKEILKQNEVLIIKQQIQIKEQEIVNLKETISAIEKRIESNQIEYMNQLNNLTTAHATVSNWNNIILIAAGVGLIGFGLWYSGLAASIFQFTKDYSQNERANITSKTSTNQVQEKLNEQIIILQEETATAISNQDKKIFNLHRTFQEGFTNLIDETQESTKQIQAEVGKQSKLINETILANIENIQRMLIVDSKAIQDLSDGVLLLNAEVSALQNQIPNNAAIVSASLFFLCLLRKQAPKFYLGVLTLDKPNEDDDGNFPNRKFNPNLRGACDEAGDISLSNKERISQRIQRNKVQIQEDTSQIQQDLHEITEYRKQFTPTNWLNNWQNVSNNHKRNFENYFTNNAQNFTVNDSLAISSNSNNIELDPLIINPSPNIDPFYKSKEAAKVTKEVIKENIQNNNTELNNLFGSKSSNSSQHFCELYIHIPKRIFSEDKYKKFYTFLLNNREAVLDLIPRIINRISGHVFAKNIGVFKRRTPETLQTIKEIANSFNNRNEDSETEQFKRLIELYTKTKATNQQGILLALFRYQKCILPLAQVRLNEDNKDIIITATYALGGNLLYLPNYLQVYLMSYTLHFLKALLTIYLENPEGYILAFTTENKEKKILAQKRLEAQEKARIAQEKVRADVGLKEASTERPKKQTTIKTVVPQSQEHSLATAKIQQWGRATYNYLFNINHPQNLTNLLHTINKGKAFKITHKQTGIIYKINICRTAEEVGLEGYSFNEKEADHIIEYDEEEPMLNEISELKESFEANSKIKEINSNSNENSEITENSEINTINSANNKLAQSGGLV